MSALKIVLAPGLDGSGLYLATMQAQLSRDYECHRLHYPHEAEDYSSLCKWAMGQLGQDGDYIVVGESFGGPLAVLLAKALGRRAKGLVLCASFLKPPIPPYLLNFCAWLYPVLRNTATVNFINLLLCNGEHPTMAGELHDQLRATPDHIISNRIRLLATVDVGRIAAKLDIPCLILKPSHERLLWFNMLDELKLKSTIKVIDGPHMLMGLKPQACAQAILDFIKPLEKPLPAKKG